VRPVRGAERVVDVQVAEQGQSPGQPFVVRLLAAEKSGVLEQQDLAVLQRHGCLQRFVGVGALHEEHLAPRHQVLEAPCDRLQ
jgi:hypothetical protein